MYAKELAHHFKKMNVFEVANYFRRNKKVDFAIIYPQLCATDGDNLWSVLLRSEGRNIIDKIIVAACDPIMQKKIFGWVFKELGFDESKFIGVEIRNMTTEEAIKAIEKELQ